MKAFILIVLLTLPASAFAADSAIGPSKNRCNSISTEGIRVSKQAKGAKTSDQQSEGRETKAAR